MTKGNWERRAEMSLIRRTEAKEKKASKNDTTKIKPESILQKLLRDEQLIQSGARINVWLSDPLENILCKCYMRRDDCRVRKCKLPHDGVTISHLRNVPYLLNPEVPNESEKAALPPMPLDEVPAKDSSRLMFIAIDGLCVFDYLYPDLWHTWLAAHLPPPPEGSPTKKSPKGLKKKSLSSVEEREEREEEDGDEGREGSGRDGRERGEGGEGREDEEKGEGRGRGGRGGRGEKGEKGEGIERGERSSEEEGESESEEESNEENPPKNIPQKNVLFAQKNVLIPPSSSKRIFFVSDGEGKTCARILSFLNNDDVVSLLSCSKVCKHTCLRDEQVRIRKKEAISLLSHDLSKRKKEEKRKKAKNACISKVDKKDAFARGATIR